MAVFQSVGTPQPQQPQPQNSEPSRAKKVMRYSMMPEILPRIRALGFHFGHFAYLLALVFASARLIPQAHPVLNAANMGRYGVRQVIAIAANNLTWSKKNIDQIAIFSAIIIGLLMIVIQVGLIAMMVVFGGEASAQAAPNPSSFFTVPNSSEDISLEYLAHIFGDLNGFWGTGVTPPGTNTRIHEGLHGFLSIYSMATMVIAVIIVLYYILTVIGETAKTGTPFGQRFNSLWAPIRLVVALGLLVPLGSGLNSAQYITLWMAKMGAGLGGQAWFYFADFLNDEEDKQYIITEAEPIWAVDFGHQVFLAEVCSAAYNQLPDAYNFDSVVEPSSDSTYSIRWFAQNPGGLANWRRNCGSASLSMPTFMNEDGQPVVPPELIKNAVDEFVTNVISAVEGPAELVAASKFPGGAAAEVWQQIMTINGLVYQEGVRFHEALEEIYEEHMVGEMDKKLDEAKQKGWMYAGVFYVNIGRIIQMSEQIKSVNIPNITLPEGQFTIGNGPSTRYQRRVERRQNYTDSFVHVDAAIDDVEEFLSDQEASEVWANRRELALQYAQTAGRIATFSPAYEAYRWMTTDPNDPACDALGVGEEGMDKVACAVYTMITPRSLILLASADEAHDNLDPMSSLMIAGRDIVDRAWKFVAVGLAGSALGSVPFVGSVFSALGGLLVLIGTVGLGAGLVLFFILPLMPFIYFFFAAVSWIMEIFEAIIAMPLWALAHLRIDGDGMPGQAAMNGYYLLLSILLRPILIISGLIGGLIIFGASVYILQDLFSPLLSVIHGDTLNGLENLLFTVFFSVICYMLGMMCFKLVDLVPNQILRWIGSGVNTFSDDKGDPVGQSQAAVFAAATFANQGVQSLTQGASGIGQSVANSRKEKRNIDQGKDKAFTETMRHDDIMEAQTGNRPGGTVSGENRQQFEARMSERASAGDSGGGGSAAARDAQRNNSDDPNRS